jgi:hypothetical protein
MQNKRSLEQPYVRRPDGILPERRSEVFRRFTPTKVWPVTFTSLTSDRWPIPDWPVPLQRCCSEPLCVVVVGRTLVPPDTQTHTGLQPTKKTDHGSRSHTQKPKLLRPDVIQLEAYWSLIFETIWLKVLAFLSHHISQTMRLFGCSLVYF